MSLAKSYLGKTVYEAALDRVAWVFDKFENVTVGCSGGKDSTATVEIALEVARKKNRLPVDVMFLDQEAEWDCVVDYMRELMGRKEVRGHWLQCPIRITNATSAEEQWLECWKPGDKWLRDKEPGSITENIYGTDRFHEMFTAYAKTVSPDKPFAYLAGVRCEESPARWTALTNTQTYKHVTWGKKLNTRKKHFTFYPLYDWSYRDIWKAIQENQWNYCKVYDYMYQHGVPVKDMRVSNVHHETSIHALHLMQEFEPENWQRLTKRLAGVNTVRQLGPGFMAPKELPRMFNSWMEYRDHLLVNLIKPEDQPIYVKGFKTDEKGYLPECHESLAKTHIAAILVNDKEGVKMTQWKMRHQRFAVNYGKRTRKYKSERGIDDQSTTKVTIREVV